MRPDQLTVPPDMNEARMTALAGDASNRRYFRIHAQGSADPSMILMKLADPEGFKQSEEATGGAKIEITELPFLNILNYLAGAGIPVPKLYQYHQEHGLLYLEDFGDVTLAQACQTASPSTVAEWYQEAIRILVRIQAAGLQQKDLSCYAFHRNFDVPLFLWEFDHFLEYGIVARNERPMCADDLAIIKKEFQRIAELLASQPQVFTHRDYHSRNLMVEETRLGVLDFQDALLGPASYDVASLLRDAYIELEESLVEALIDLYLAEASQHGLPTLPSQAFRRLFDLTSIQRNLKAAGRFVYIDRVKKNPKFLADIPRTLGYVRNNLSRYPELETLRKHLSPYVPELQ